MENQLAVTGSDRMAGVVTSVVADNKVEIGCQDVDNLSLPFITPLGADNHDVFHKNVLSWGALFGKSLPKSKTLSPAAKPGDAKVCRAPGGIAGPHPNRRTGAYD